MDYEYVYHLFAKTFCSLADLCPHLFTSSCGLDSKHSWRRVWCIDSPTSWSMQPRLLALYRIRLINADWLIQPCRSCHTLSRMSKNIVYQITHDT